jgi:hypothetical protein
MSGKNLEEIHCQKEMNPRKENQSYGAGFLHSQFFVRKKSVIKNLFGTFQYFCKEEVRLFSSFFNSLLNQDTIKLKNILINPVFTGYIDSKELMAGD